MICKIRSELAEQSDLTQSGTRKVKMEVERPICEGVRRKYVPKVVNEVIQLLRHQVSITGSPIHERGYKYVYCRLYSL